MALPLKVAATVGAVGVGSLAGCYFGGVFSDTPWVSLKEDGASSYTNKVGAKYSIYLLAVHGNEGDKKKDLNEAKWKELYKKYLADLSDSTKKRKMSTEFQEGQVNKDEYYSKDGDTDKTPKTLNKVCKEIYEKSVDTDVDFSLANDSESKYKLARDLLKYCSPLGQKPTTVGDNGGYSNGSLGDTKKSTLVSTSDSGNYYFWEAQEKWFLRETEVKSDAFFKTFFSGDKLKIGWRLKDICHKAYGLVGVDSDPKADNPKKSDVEKYCSFKEITSS